MSLLKVIQPSLYLKIAKYAIVIIPLVFLACKCYLLSKERDALQNQLTKIKIAKIEVERDLAFKTNELNNRLFTVANEAATAHEEKKLKDRIILKEVEKEVEKIVRVPVYSSVCIDTSGLHTINQLIGETSTVTTIGKSTGNPSKP